MNNLDLIKTPQIKTSIVNQQCSPILAKIWLKISAISESRLTIFPSSIKVIAEFTCTLSENSGFKVLQNL